ncbi:hypothetical protein [Ascidiimonas sp. W6]|uniref:hypothetical protein n=1 Tax=Ascidiimonas meishanensis TaxID=3128903 RepID=UPI0030EC8527
MVVKKAFNDTIIIIKNTDTLNLHPLNKKIGGLRVGIKNATWPFASLSASGGQLVISSIYGTYKFNENEILDLSEYVLIPLLGQGIKISHTKKEYPSQIIFWYFGKLEKLIKEIKTHLNETK